VHTTRAIVFVAMVVGALGCDDGETDPCPKIKAGGGKIAPVVAPGAAPVPSGGALVSGTFNLSKLDIVLASDVSAEGRVKCEALSAATQQDTLRFTASSATEGSLVSVSVGDDGNGVTTENRSSGSYVSSGSTLTITVSGAMCETMLVPQADGGIAESRVVDDKDSMVLSREYTSVGNTLSFVGTLAASGQTDCVVVSTYDKQ
jgi:hypothetical protein